MEIVSPKNQNRDQNVINRTALLGTCSLHTFNACQERETTCSELAVYIKAFCCVTITDCEPSSCPSSYYCCCWLLLMLNFSYVHRGPRYVTPECLEMTDWWSWRTWHDAFWLGWRYTDCGLTRSGVLWEFFLSPKNSHIFCVHLEGGMNTFPWIHI